MNGEFSRTLSGLTEVPSDIPKGTIIVNLFENNITAIRSGTFYSLYKCILLRLDYNYISDIEPGGFTGMKNLEELTLYNNQLVEIRAEMWKGLDSLRRLELDHNTIRGLPSGCFEGLDTLHFLYLFQNEIRDLRRGVFTNLYHLKILDLSKNQISSIDPGSLVGLPELEELILTGNELATFGEDVFTPGIYPLNLVLKISENPLVCDREMCWLKESRRKEKWIQFLYVFDAPECINYPDVPWDEVKLECRM